MAEPGKHEQAIALRISVTDRCQLRCAYCRPLGRIERLAREEILRSAEIVRCAEVLQRHFGLTKLRLTGGDPLLRRGIVDLVAALAGLGAPDLALTTNGQALAELAAPLREAGLARVNVSLDSLRPEAFARISRGGSLSRTLAGIEAALAAGLAPVRLNAVVIRGVNHEETADLVAFALACGCEQRFIELMPTGLPPRRYREWFVPADEILRALGARFALAPLPQPPGSSSRRYRVTASRGRIGAIGLISPTTRPFCAGCRRLRLTADGRLVGCLGRRETVPVRHLLRDGAAEETIVHAAAAALACKRSLTFTPPVVMSAVGG